MIKIFSSGKKVYLLSHHDAFEPNPASIVLSISSDTEIRDFYNELIGNDSIKEVFFLHPDEELLFKWFKSMFKVVEAAGGLVKNKKGEYLFIFRNGKWDIPKGKIEKGEGIETAALREVEEECGIGKLKIIKVLPTTYHTYPHKDTIVLKPTYWFGMSSDDTSVLKPQTEEGITEVRWIAPEDIGMVYGNTYESIIDIVSSIKA